MSYVSDAPPLIIKDAIGAEPPNPENRMDRRTACLQQADVFREMAIADPEHHDLWIDEAIKWLERAREASSRVAVTVEIRNGCIAPKEQPTGSNQGKSDARATLTTSQSGHPRRR